MMMRCATFSLAVAIATSITPCFTLPVQAREYAGLDVHARDLDGERAMTRGHLGVPRSMQLRDLEEVLARDGSHHDSPRRGPISRPQRKGASGWASERKATGLWDRMFVDELD